MPEDRKAPLQSLDIVSFLVLLLALTLFWYMAFYRTAQQNKRHFTFLTQKVEQDLRVLSEAQRIRAQANKDPQNGPDPRADRHEKDPISDVPLFLRKINSETLACGMELSHIEKVDNITYKLTAFAPFSRLVHFLFEVEESNLAIQDLDIHPFSAHQNQIKMTLKVLDRKMSKDNEQVLRNFRQEHDRAFPDPFQRSRGIVESTAAPDVIDLTWKFKLTGIGFGKEKSANIDHKHYHEGDLFNDMRVVKIRKDRVDLESDSQKFFIAFRMKKQAGK